MLEVIILAGGFATRLYPLSQYIPKPLLPICGVPLINYIIDRIMEIKPKRIIISTNRKFEYNFRYWIRTLPLETRYLIELIVEPTKSNEEKFGAVYGLYHTIKEAWVEDDLIVIAGDNLFDFDLRKIKRTMKENNSFVVGLYDVENLELAKRYGVAIVDDNNKIIDFEEKPKKPKSTLISTGIYGIPKKKINKIDEYLSNQSIDKDKLGSFIKYLVENDNVYGYIFKGLWFDIGNLDSYVEANFKIEKIGLFRKWI